MKILKFSPSNFDKQFFVTFWTHNLELPATTHRAHPNAWNFQKNTFKKSSPKSTKQINSIAHLCVCIVHGG